MNLLSLIENQFSPQTVQQISGAVGESPEGTKSALSTAFPALLGSLVGKATSSPNGPTEIYNMVQSGVSQGGWSDSIKGMLGNFTGAGAQPAAVPAAGGSLLNSLLGSKLGAVGEFIASHCGIKSSSAMSLLGMAAPLLMGTIGKHVTSQGLGASGLGQLLTSQTQYLKGALPSGLANTLGIGNLLSSGRDAAAAVTSNTAARFEQGASSKVLRYALGLILVALVGWLAVRWSHNRTPAGGTSGGETQPQTGQASSMQPDIRALNLTPGSTADQLAQAVKSGDFNHPITFEGMPFDSAGNVPESARSQLQQINSVLNEAPNVKIKITGFGETEDAGVNQANGIKSALTAAGVSPNRITTAGQAGTGVPVMNVMR